MDKVKYKSNNQERKVKVRRLIRERLGRAIANLYFGDTVEESRAAGGSHATALTNFALCDFLDSGTRARASQLTDQVILELHRHKDDLAVRGLGHLLQSLELTNLHSGR